MQVARKIASCDMGLSGYTVVSNSTYFNITTYPQAKHDHLVGEEHDKSWKYAQLRIETTQDPSVPYWKYCNLQDNFPLSRLKKRPSGCSYDKI